MLDSGVWWTPLAACFLAFSAYWRGSRFSRQRRRKNKRAQWLRDQHSFKPRSILLIPPSPSPPPPPLRPLGQAALSAVGPQFSSG